MCNVSMRKSLESIFRICLEKGMFPLKWGKAN